MTIARSREIYLTQHLTNLVEKVMDGEAKETFEKVMGTELMGALAACIKLQNPWKKEEGRNAIGTGEPLLCQLADRADAVMLVTNHYLDPRNDMREEVPDMNSLAGATLRETMEIVRAVRDVGVHHLVQPEFVEFHDILDILHVEYHRYELRQPR